MADYSAHHIEIGDYRFHWLESVSQGSDRPSHKRPTIVFLHGFMGCSTDWQNIMERLGEAYHTLAIDLPGHGQTQMIGRSADSEHPAFGMEHLAPALMALLDRMSLAQCHLVGYSMGGRLALYLALHYPHHIDRLILESASPGLALEAERQARQQHDEHLAHRLERLETQDLEAFLHQWYQQPLFGHLSRHPSFAAMYKRRLANRPDRLARSLRQMGTGSQPSLWETIRNHTCPTLLLVGEQDWKFRAIATAMKERCAAITVQVVPRCSHTIHLEQPHPFTDAIARFLSDSPNSKSS